jgi:hypothetical protein
MVELVAYAKKNHTPGGMSTTQVRNWLKKNKEMVPRWLQDQEWSVDHIVADKLGGPPWPHNYFISESCRGAILHGNVGARVRV